MKRCKTCGHTKTEDAFRLHKSRWRGGSCRVCEKIISPESSETKSVRRKQHYANNRDKELQGVKSWVESNRQAKYSCNRRRDQNKLSMSPLRQQDWDEVLKEQGDVCLVCRSPEITVDHICPISKGGNNSKDNLQPLCRSCNSSKGANTIDYRRLISSKKKSAA